MRFYVSAIVVGTVVATMIVGKVVSVMIFGTVVPTKVVGTRNIHKTNVHSNNDC